MKLFELQELLNGVQYRAAVYDELVALLQKSLDEGLEVPVDIGDGVVPESYIQEVISELKARRGALLQKLELADAVEVTGVDEQDFAVG